MSITYILIRSVQLLLFWLFYEFPWNVLYLIVEHALAPESGAFPGDIAQIYVVLVDVLVPGDVVVFLWNELALLVVEFEVEHGLAHLVDAGVELVFALVLFSLLV